MPSAQPVSTAGLTVTCAGERRKLLSWVLTEPWSFEGATVSEAARYTKCDSSSTRCFLQTTEGPIAIATARAPLYDLPYMYRSCAPLRKKFASGKHRRAAYVGALRTAGLSAIRRRATTRAGDQEQTWPSSKTDYYPAVIQCTQRMAAPTTLRSIAIAITDAHAIRPEIV